MVNLFEKVSGIILLIVCANFSLSIYFNYYHLFYTDGKAKYQPRVDGSEKPVFIQENNLKLLSHPVEFVDTIFPVYKKNKSENQETLSLLSNEELMEFSNKKVIDKGMIDTRYPIFLPATIGRVQ